MTDFLDFRIDLSDADTVSAYDELPLWSAQAGLLLLEHLELSPRARILDAGCGTGFPLIELAERSGAGATVYGVDPWRAALQRARFKAAVRGVSNAHVVEGDVAALPFPNEHFDLIVSNLGVNNFERPDAALRECRRVARARSRLALSTNLRGHMREFYEIFEATLTESGTADAVEALRAHVDHRATVDGLSALLERAGFRVTRVERASAVMRFANGGALFRHYFVKLGFLDGWKSVVEPERRARVFERLERELDRAAGARDLRLTIPFAYVEARPA